MILTKPKITPQITWNSVLYLDCMNETYGLPSLPDHSFDFCFTDPPFNTKLKVNRLSDGHTNLRESSIKYQDNRTQEEYRSFCEAVFFELKRLCNTILIYCGKKNLNMWYKIQEPYDVLYLLKENAQSGSRGSYFNRVYPILVYGKPSKKIPLDYFKYPSKVGILSSKCFIHPCPLNEEF